MTAPATSPRARVSAARKLRLGVRRGLRPLADYVHASPRLKRSIIVVLSRFPGLRASLASVSGDGSTHRRPPLTPMVVGQVELLSARALTVREDLLRVAAAQGQAKQASTRRQA